MGGATLAIELFGSAPDGSFNEAAGGTVHCDGLRRDYAPGEVLMLAPGESVTLRPGNCKQAGDALQQDGCGQIAP